MALEHLGEVFDIHGGGLDLVFPHHENEIAQSRCAHGTAEMARLWMHNGYVVVNGEKMAKSAGNFFTVRRLLEEGLRGEAIRLALLSGHYRAPLDITREKIAECKGQLDRLYGALRGVNAVADAEQPAAVMAALADDLNTPLAVAELHEIASAMNKAKDEAKREALAGGLLAGGALLGLLQDDPEAWFKGAPAEGALAAEQVEAMIAARIAARRAKNFTEADRIRDDLLAQGITLEDGPAGTIWRRVD
jgi:cysteinyl-tRNA synthetase